VTRAVLGPFPGSQRAWRRIERDRYINADRSGPVPI
jgi:hypothetical protein